MRPEPPSSAPRQGVGLRHVATAARVIWGATLLLKPRRVIEDLPNRRIDRPNLIVARVLGARHLIEATFAGRRARGFILCGVAIDAVHAVTCLGLAMVRPDRKRLAVSNAATATAFAIAGLVESRSARPRPDGRPPRRTGWASDRPATTGRRTESLSSVERADGDSHTYRSSSIP